MPLADLLDTQLPLNRKERYFTGTVFPMIVAADGFRDLHLLAELIPGCALPPIDPDPRMANIEFFTEYSLVESIYGAETKKRFPDPPKTKDTPDIILLVRGEQTQLLAFEAKMYDRPAPATLAGQMSAQRVQLEYMREQLSLDAVHHVALLPAKYVKAVQHQLAALQSGPDPFPIVLWEDILQAYRRVRGDTDYFLGMLAEALERWDELAAKPAKGKANAEWMLTGTQIVSDAAGHNSLRVVGRRGGLTGAALAKDIASGTWHTRKYEVSSNPELSRWNPNWFTVQEFVALTTKGK